MSGFRTIIFWPGQVKYSSLLVPGQVEICNISTALIEALTKDPKFLAYDRSRQTGDTWFRLLLVLAGGGLQSLPFFL